MSDPIAASTSTVATIGGKPWYRSKTLWFNAACAMLAVAELNFGLLQGRIPGGFYTWMAFVLPVGNALLRIITTTALVMPRIDQPAPPGQAGVISLAMLGWLRWLPLLALLLWGGYQMYSAGERANQNKCLAQQAAQAKLDQAERERGAALARHAAQYEIDQQQREAAAAMHLEGVMKNARRQFALLAAAPRLGLAGAGAGGGAAHAGADRCAARAADEHSAAQDHREPVPIDRGSRLTLGAVWMWDAALSGQAAAAAGACRVDAATGQADPACAQPSGLTLDDAFANHALNAASCAADRARHQRLIDYLQSFSQTRID